MTDRPLRVGLVGAGWAAQQHTQSLATLGEAPPVLVTDLDPARARDLAQTCGAEVVGGVADLVAAGLDVAVVTTPAGVHAEAMVPLIEAGIAVFVEKPLCLTLPDARRVVAAAAAAAVPVAVGYQWRAVPVLERLRDELSGQRIALLLSQGIGITQARSWFADPQLSGGLLGERGSHHLNLLQAVAGPVAEVRVVAGHVPVSGEPCLAEPPTDVVTVVCTHVSGTVSMTALVWASPAHLPEQSLRVVGDNGHYLVALDPDFTLTGRTGDRDVDAAAGHEHPPFVRQLGRFLAAVRAGDPTNVVCTPAQAAETVALAAAAATAMRTGSAERVSAL